MTKEDAKKLIDRIDAMGILNPRVYELGLDDSPIKRKFMDNYTAQAQWITDAYTALMSYWNESVGKAIKANKQDQKH